MSFFNCVEESSKLATRKASQNCLEFFCAQLPEMIGGSADLTGSNNTLSSSNTELLPESQRNSYLLWGKRIGMTGITNGMILHGGSNLIVELFCIYGLCKKCSETLCIDEDTKYFCIHS